MKRIIALSLVCTLCLSGCVSQNNDIECTSSAIMTGECVTNTIEDIVTTETKAQLDSDGDLVEFANLSDPALLQYIEENVYDDLVNILDNDFYIVENVSARYISKEYLEEVSYNSHANIYFGYTLAEVEKQFQGSKYVFSLGEDGKTIVQAFEKNASNFDEAIKNVVMETGVILIEVTVAVISGLTISKVNILLGASKTGKIVASMVNGLIVGVSTGITTGIETNDFDLALEDATAAGLEEFTWCALAGVLETK